MDPLKRAVHVAYMDKPRSRQVRPQFKKGPPRTFLRAWRLHCGKTLETAAAYLHITHASLSRIERDEQPYSQPILEGLAELYGTDVASLLMRDPTDPEGMWSVWDQAKPGERRQIVEVAKTLIKTSAR